MRLPLTILVDDEKNNLDYLSLVLSALFPGLPIVAKVQSPEEAMLAIQKWQPELVFLDIELPGMNGFEMLNQLGKVDFEVIFVTAHAHYALQAFDKFALGYLTKPIAEDKLQAVVEKALQRLQSQQVQSQLSGFLSHLSSTEAPPATAPLSKIALPTQTGVQFMEAEQIVYAESNGNYTWFHLLDGQKVLVSRQLGEYEKLLPAHLFCRIHDKYLVHLAHLQSYTKGAGGEVTLRNGGVLPVAVRRKDQLLQLFDAWLKRH